MRRLLLAAVLSVMLVIPAAAQATSVGASAHGLRATLSYSGGPGITTKHERLTITQGGKVVYARLVPANGCFKVCGPGSKHPVVVTSLYGDDGEDVVLTLWNGGADCCTLADVYVPSAAVHSYVLDQHNFGEAGFTLKDMGPKAGPSSSRRIRPSTASSQTVPPRVCPSRSTSSTRSALSMSRSATRSSSRRTPPGGSISITRIRHRGLA